MGIPAQRASKTSRATRYFNNGRARIAALRLQNGQDSEISGPAVASKKLMSISIHDNWRLAVFLLILGAPHASAQGRIDPALPPEPVAFTRTLLLFPGVDTVKDPDAVLPALTTKQKYWIFWRRTFDQSLPVEALMFAAGSQATQYSPRYGDGPGPFAERFGSYAGSIASSSLFTDAMLPSIFHQDPRYFRKGRGSVMSRLWYAVKSEVVTRNDNGTMGFNESAVLGFGMSTALTNAWYPRSSVTFSSTMTRYAIKMGVSVVLNVVREFGGSDEPTPER
jgi:hypothetical protein